MPGRYKIEREEELEYKFRANNLRIITLTQFFEDRGFNTCSPKQECRDFVYFDTPEYSLLDNGITFREVRPHDATWIRYDMKIETDGVRDRSESSFRSDAGPVEPSAAFSELYKALTPELQSKFDSLHKCDQTLATAACFSLRRELYRMSAKGTTFELCDDTVYDSEDNAVLFREIEMEFIEGDRNTLDELAQLVEQSLGLQPESRCKLATVLALGQSSH